MRNNFKHIFQSELVKEVNANIISDGFVLVLSEKEEGRIWLVSTSGEIVHRNVDISEFGQDINMLDFNSPYGFDFCVANICDGILMMAGIDLLGLKKMDELTNTHAVE